MRASFYFPTPKTAWAYHQVVNFQKQANHSFHRHNNCQSVRRLSYCRGAELAVRLVGRLFKSHVWVERLTLVAQVVSRLAWSSHSSPGRSSFSEFKTFYNAQLMEGHICCRMQNMITKIKPKDVQTTTNGDYCVHYERNGQMAKSTQWVFKDGETILHLSNLLRGKIHVDIFPSSALRVANLVNTLDSIM